MSIVTKVKSVRRLFEQLEQALSSFRQNTGMQCLTHCGHCCTKADIEATVLEFLPLAFDLFLQRKTETIKTILTEKSNAVCYAFRPSPLSTDLYTLGRCSAYEHRGLICRLFGFAAVHDKHGQPALSTCQWIKKGQPEAVERGSALAKIGQAPSYRQFYQRLIQIDFRLGNEHLPINEAILRAIEEVEHYYQYRPFPYRYRKPRDADEKLSA
jgi:Fe-S-cluster containining protein